jgi:hypothetical protein
MKLPLFQQMVELNRSFDEVTAGLLGLESVPFFQRELIRHALSPSMRSSRIGTTSTSMSNPLMSVENAKDPLPCGHPARLGHV